MSDSDGPCSCHDNAMRLSQTESDEIGSRLFGLATGDVTGRCSNQP